MKPGPPRTPTNLLEMRGSSRAKGRGEAAGEPRPVDASPEPPIDLTGEARDKWLELAGPLIDLGLLTVLDRDALAIYCRVWAELREAEKFLDEKGAKTFVVRDKDGAVRDVRSFPQVAMVAKSREFLRKFAAEFGFTPARRAGLVLRSHEVENDPLGQLLARGSK